MNEPDYLASCCGCWQYFKPIDLCEGLCDECVAEQTLECFEKNKDKLVNDELDDVFVSAIPCESTYKQRRRTM